MEVIKEGKGVYIGLCDECYWIPKKEAIELRDKLDSLLGDNDGK